MIYKEILDTFGKLLIEKTRDYQLECAEKTLEQKAKSPDYKQIGALLGDLEVSQKQAILELVAHAVTGTLHGFFELIAWKNKQIKLVFTKDEQEYNLEQISDGLAGEMFAKGGWIDKFSKYHFDENFMY